MSVTEAEFALNVKKYLRLSQTEDVYITSGAVVVAKLVKSADTEEQAAKRRRFKEWLEGVESQSGEELSDWDNIERVIKENREALDKDFERRQTEISRLLGSEEGTP